MDHTPIWQRRADKLNTKFNKDLSMLEPHTYNTSHAQSSHQRRNSTGYKYNQLKTPVNGHVHCDAIKRSGSNLHFSSNNIQQVPPEPSPSIGPQSSLPSYNGDSAYYRDNTYNFDRSQGCYSADYRYGTGYPDYSQNRNGYINLFLAQRRPIYSLAYKQQRRRHNKQEIQILEAAFAVNSLPDKEEKHRICQKTGLSPKNVRIWFQNKRQAVKRQSLELKKQSQDQDQVQDQVQVQNNDNLPKPDIDNRHRAASEHSLAFSSTYSKGLESFTPQNSHPNSMNHHEQCGKTLNYSYTPNQKNDDLKYLATFKSTLHGYSAEPRHISKRPININAQNSRPNNIRESSNSVDYNNNLFDNSFIGKLPQNHIYDRADGSFIKRKAGSFDNFTHEKSVVPLPATIYHLEKQQSLDKYRIMDEASKNFPKKPRCERGDTNETQKDVSKKQSFNLEYFQSPKNLNETDQKSSSASSDQTANNESIKLPPIRQSFPQIFNY